MPRRISRGEIYWLDQTEMARLAATSAGLTNPPSPAGPPQERIGYQHPFLVIQSSSLCQGLRSYAVGVFLTSIEDTERVRFSRPYNVVLEANEVQSAEQKLRVARCNQVYTMDTSTFIDPLLGRLSPAALRRVTDVVVKVVGGRDP